MNFDIEHIKSLSDETWINSALELFILLAPGFVYLYTVRYNIFLDLDIFRLIMISIFYSLPSYILVGNTLKKTIISEKQESILTDIDKVEIEIHENIFISDSIGIEKLYKPYIERIKKLREKVSFTQEIKVSIILISLFFTYLNVNLNEEYFLNPVGFWLNYYVLIIVNNYVVKYYFDRSSDST